MPSFLKLNLKFPSKRQWTHFFHLLTTKEKVWFFSLLAIFLASAGFLYSDFYFNNTFTTPAKGGRIKQGFVGQPQFINPLLSSASEIDKSLVELTFSGLMTYDQEGNAINDLIAGNPDFKDGGKTMEFAIKEGVKWQDGQSLNMDDIVFTINAVQNSRYSSDLRPNWQQVEVEKISDTVGRLKLKQPYSGLLENLAALKILPKHIWQDVQPENLTLMPNLNIFNPVGSGPYKVKQVKQKDNFIESITLARNNSYSGKEPYLDEVEFVFFKQKKEMMKALDSGQIQSASLESYQDYSQKDLKKFELNELQTPSYFAAFFNMREDLFAEKDIRDALLMATDKNEIRQNALNEKANLIDSPLIPDFYGFSAPTSVYAFDLEKAKALIEDQDFTIRDGWAVKTLEKLPKFQFKKDLVFGNKGTDVEKLQECLAKDSEVYPEGTITGEFGDKTKAAVIKFQEKYASEILAPSNLTKGNGKVLAGTRDKLNQLCYPSPTEETVFAFTLTTVNDPDLIKVAEVLKNQWAKIGAKVEIRTVESSEIKKVIIQNRDFQVLLFGETLSSIPDPLPFWHSLQSVDPGLNLTGYDNEKADELLEQARKYADPKDPERQKTLEQLQDIIISDNPAIMLYSQNHLYLTNKSIKGFGVKKMTESAKIFSDLPNWYVNTERQWKK